MVSPTGRDLARGAGEAAWLGNELTQRIGPLTRIVRSGARVRARLSFATEFPLRAHVARFVVDRAAGLSRQAGVPPAALRSAPAVPSARCRRVVQPRPAAAHRGCAGRAAFAERAMACATWGRAAGAGAVPGNGRAAP